MYLLLQSDTQIQTSLVPDTCNFSLPGLLHQASHFQTIEVGSQRSDVSRTGSKACSLQWPSGEVWIWARIVCVCYCARGFPMDQMLQSSNPAVSAHS